MSDAARRRDAGDVGVVERTAADEKRARPRRYAVVVLNDDFTPIDFVVSLLVETCRHARDEASRLAMKIHVEGRAHVAYGSREVAETIAARIVVKASAAGHPLQATIEPVESDDDGRGDE